MMKKAASNAAGSEALDFKELELCPQSLDRMAKQLDSLRQTVIDSHGSVRDIILASDKMIGAKRQKSMGSKASKKASQKLKAKNRKQSPKSSGYQAKKKGTAGATKNLSKLNTKPSKNKKSSLKPSKKVA